MIYGSGTMGLLMLRWQEAALSGGPCRNKRERLRRTDNIRMLAPRCTYAEELDRRERWELVIDANGVAQQKYRTGLGKGRKRGK